MLHLRTPACIASKVLDVSRGVSVRRCGVITVQRSLRLQVYSNSAGAPSAEMSKRERGSTPDWQQEPPYLLVSEEEGFKPLYESSCVCGAVRYAVDCEPKSAKFCHCCSCQRIHGAPFQWAGVFPKSNVRFMKGVDKIAFFNTQDKCPKHELPCKVSCTACHSPIAAEGRNMWMGFVPLFDFPNRKVPDCFQPDSHIFYAERCMAVKDGMPKWAGFKDDSEKLSDDDQK